MATPRQAREALLAFKKGLPVAVIRGLRKGMPIAIKYARTKYMTRKNNRHPFKAFDPAEPPPGPLGIRQGNLVRTLRIGAMRYTGKKVIATLEAGSAEVRYAAIHEFGGVIKAKNGPNLIFFSNAGSGPFKVMKPSVRMPARPYLTPALQDATPEIEKHIIAEVRTLARATLKGVARFR